MLIGGVYVMTRGMAYSFGVPEHVSESREGTEYIPGRPPGSKADRLGVQIGLWLIAIGILTAAGTGIVHLIYRSRGAVHPRQTMSRRE